jgi:DNA-binding transcriptional regulator YiaG
MAQIKSKTSNRTALVAWMQARKIRSEDFARVMGVGKSTVYGWRKGYPPSRGHAALLQKVTEGAVPADGWD